IGSNDAWLARAAGEPFLRARESEFMAQSDAPRLIAAIEDARREAKRRLILAAAIPPDTIRVVRRLDATHDVELTVAWCVAHALMHCGEHWGQIQLTRQFYDARQR